MEVTVEATRHRARDGGANAVLQSAEEDRVERAVEHRSAKGV
jgi:hypothetical protein